MESRRTNPAERVVFVGGPMSYDTASVRRLLDQARAQGKNSLTAPEAKGLCDAIGVPSPREVIAGSAAESGRAATAIGFPVVMKIVSPDILHKTEAGGVIVDV